jgi:hypothetical protein
VTINAQSPVVTPTRERIEHRMLRYTLWTVFHVPDPLVPATPDRSAHPPAWQANDQLRSSRDGLAWPAADSDGPRRPSHHTIHDLENP